MVSSSASTTGRTSKLRPVAGAASPQPQRGAITFLVLVGVLCACCALTLHTSWARSESTSFVRGLYRVVSSSPDAATTLSFRSGTFPGSEALEQRDTCLDREALFKDVDLLFRNQSLRADVACTQRMAAKLAEGSEVGTHFLASPSCARARWEEKAEKELERDLGMGRRVRCYTEAKSKIFKREHGGGLVVSFSHKLIYIPNMKVASQMFKGVMEERFDGEVINQNYLRKALREHNHSINDYYVFTFVRDPLKHFISAYSEVDRRLTKVWLRKPAYAPKGFIAIQRNASYEPERALAALEEIRSGEHRGLTPSHMYSQFWKINRCLTRNKMPLVINFIGKIENLVDEWKKIEKHLGVQSKELRFSHSGTHIYKKHAQSVELVPNDPQHPNVALVQKICEYYSLDYECFDYTLPAVCKG